MPIISPTQNLEILKRQALARVYALLVRLAEDKESSNLEEITVKAKKSNQYKKGNTNKGLRVSTQRDQKQ